MGKERLELSRIATLVPKTSASTNSATRPTNAGRGYPRARCRGEPLGPLVGCVPFAVKDQALSHLYSCKGEGNWELRGFEYRILPLNLFL